MCRSPLLSGPFSVTSNRALEEALAALNPSSSRHSATAKRAATCFVDAVERKLTVATRNSALEVQISVANATETENMNWTTLQCVFYVVLFFVFVFFLRVQEEEFAESTRHLRRPH
ncbi:hypothetical protein PHMEG_00013156 [Phytophthora megakarya]|uniref:Uncharacterized protein n=1 Tax=Phytophthora megakarya TaxID=4795 RepID=A0A225W6X2_9STRA|nr:hypothetical protein PHMEG_00013156 [Phytophthora megakarya]